jgi:hypothetical protein
MKPMENSTQNTYLVDGVSAIALRNGVARLQFLRLGLDGKPVNSHEVHIPLPALKSVSDALR